MLRRIIVSFFALFLLLSSLPTNIEASTVTEASKKNELIDFARKYIGVRYQFGGTTPSGFDCSGYVRYAFNHIGITLPRTTTDQYNFGKGVSKSDLQTGDIVFFETYRKGASHSGIYIGDNKFIHASSSGVMISSVNDPYYYGPKYYGARRVFKDVPVEKLVQEVQVVKSILAPVKVLPPLPIGEFHDVSEDFWAYNEITALAKAGIINGRAGSVFDPNDSLTRAQAAIILTNALALEPSMVTTSFNDVSKDHWAASAIATAAKHGIFNGDENGDFRPNDLLTRAHAAVILANALKFDYAQVATIKTSSFSDISNSFWAYPEIESLAANGIIGSGEYIPFSPSDMTTRAHFSVMVYNSLQ